MNRALLFWLAMLMAFAGAMVFWYASQRQPPEPEVGTVTVVDEQASVPEPILTEFEFTDQLGQTFGSQDLQGKVWIGSFFFADCPQLCVMQNNEIKKIHERFLEDDLRVVSITVSPQKDPPHRLREYAPRFASDNEHWKFLTGKSIEYVQQVAVDIFGVAAADETHTAQVVVFDREGKRHGTFKVTSEVEFAKLVTEIEALLRDEPAPAGASAEHETAT